MLLPVELLAAIAQADTEEDGSPLQPAPDIDLPDCLVAPAAVAARQAAAAAALGLRAREAMVAENAATAAAPAQAWYEPLPAPDAAAAASSALAPFSLNDVAPLMLPPHSGAGPDSSSSSSSLVAGAASDLPPAYRCVDPLSGLVTLRLRNGMQLVYRPSRYEPHTVAVTLLARGGKEVEGATGWGFWPEAGRYGPRCGSRSSLVPPFPAGASDLALRTLLSSSAGGHAAATIERLCGLWGLSMSSSAAAETLAITCSAVSSGSAIAEGGASSDSGVVTLPTDASGVQAAAAAAAPSALLVGGSPLSESGVALSHILQLLHLFLFACEWDEGALARCREDKASELADLPTSLEQLTDLALVLDSYGHGEASVQVPTPSAVRSYPKAMLQGCMAAQLHPGNLQLVVTGDCAWREVEALVAAYLGPWTPEAAGRHLAPLPADGSAGAASLCGAAAPVHRDPLSPLCALTPSSYVTPAAGDAVTALSPAAPQRATGADASDEEEGESEGEGAEAHGAPHAHSGCEHSHGSKQRGPGKRPAGSRMRKARGKAAAAAAAAVPPVKLHREILPVPLQLASAMRLHSFLLRVLEGTGEGVAAASGTSTVAGTAGTDVPAAVTAAVPAAVTAAVPDTATAAEAERWVPPLADASGHLAWVAPFSGSVADMLAALGRAAAAASPADAVADVPATATPVLRPIGVPLPPVLLSGRVLTVPQERESRCILSATCPALGKYWQDMVAQAGRAAAAAAASGSAAGAAAGSLLASGTISLRDVDAALAVLSPGFDSAALPVLLHGPSAEAASHAPASASLGSSPPSVRGVNRRHPLFLYRCANVWSEVINNRMYRVLRDESGSCYSAGFSLSGYEFRQGGFGHVTATPIPAHTATVLAAAVRVLVGTLSGGWPLSAAEVEEARTPVVHEIASNLRTNGYWIRLAQHQGGFHGSRRSVGASLYGMQAFYEQVTPADVQAALAFEWAAAPHPLPLHVVVGVAAGPTAKGGRKGRQGGRRRASSGESGAAGHAGGDAAAAHAATVSAIRRELGLPAAAVGAGRGKGSKATSSGAEGASASSSHAHDHALAHLSLPDVWEDLVAAASRAFYAGKA
jgi:predicted Zn-dependent peptidase